MPAISGSLWLSHSWRPHPVCVRGVQRTKRLIVLMKEMDGGKWQVQCNKNATMTEVTPFPMAANAPSMRPKRRRTTVSFTIICFLALIVLETKVHGRLGVADLSFETPREKSKSTRNQDEMELQGESSKPLPRPNGISDSIRNEYKQWHSVVRKMSQMDQFPTNWSPGVNWEHHETSRSKRFPTVDERIKYYMGRWHNVSIPMYGVQFDRDTYIQRQSTLQYEAFADILVNLYDLDRNRLMECYLSKKELKVFAPYCRDYIDIAILHSGGSANVIHFIGDTLPSYVPDELIKYPMFAKVRALCNDDDDSAYVNSFCKKHQSVHPIILPLNRKRHLGVAAEVPHNDIPWHMKMPLAVWRGKYEKIDNKFLDTGSIGGSPDMKFALVSKHLNSSLVDAKFSKHNDDAPVDMVGSYMDMKEQLKYKYIISIEG